MEQHVNLNNVAKFESHFSQMKRTVLILLFVLVGATATNIAKAQTIIDEGTCGENLTWQLTDDGVLAISGSGAMDNYYPNIYPGPNIAPWDSYKEDIETVIIGDEATTIGAYAFFGCSSLTSVIIPNAVTWIEESAFSGCKKLASVTIGESVIYIGIGAFVDCNALRTIICKATTPPNLVGEDLVFGWGVYVTLVIIPCNTSSAYMSSVWGDLFSNFEEDCNGLNDVVQNENISIYPNPAKDRFLVGFEGFMTIKLYDVLGKEVQNQETIGKTEIDTSNLPAGMYFIRITTETGVVVKKVVKQ